jgi:peptidyl-prolyl cis-trans isomerase D
MFEFIRTHQRLMQFLLLLIIAPAFIFTGVQGYNAIIGDPNSVAKVCGGSISMQDFERSQQEYLANMRAQLGPNFRSEFFNTPEARNAILERLVNQRALACMALKRNIIASDELLRKSIAQDENFQLDGKFNADRYKAMLMGNGLSPAGYETLLRQQLAMQALSSAVLLTGSSPQSVQGLVVRAQEEQREVQEFLVKSDAYISQVKLDADAAKKYYDSHQKEFQVPPQMRAEYVVLSADSLAAGIVPDANEVKQFYDQNQAKFGQPEQRQARHILILAPATAPAAEIAAAKAKAEGLLAQVKADPKKFADLAKQNSQDPGSASKGGEVDYAPRNGTYVKPFEDKLFSLKEGEISDVVQTEYGFHIIQLAGIRPASIKPFEQVRAEIEADWKKQRAQKIYADSIDGFSDIVYSQSDSLKPAADKYKLKVQATDQFSRASAPKELANAKLLDKLFGDDAIKNKRNTEAVEVSPGVLVSARVTEFKPQSVRPFEEAKAQITTLLTQQEAQALARKEGEAKLKAAQGSIDAVAFGAAKTVSRAKAEGTPPEAAKAVMGAPVDKLPAVVGVSLADGGYAVYRINKVSQPEKADPALQEQIKAVLARSQSEAEFNAFLESLKRAAKIELHPEALAKSPNN